MKYKDRRFKDQLEGISLKKIIFWLIILLILGFYLFLKFEELPFSDKARDSPYRKDKPSIKTQPVRKYDPSLIIEDLQMEMDLSLFKEKFNLRDISPKKSEFKYYFKPLGQFVLVSPEEIIFLEVKCERLPLPDWLKCEKAKFFFMKRGENHSLGKVYLIFPKRDSSWFGEEEDCKKMGYPLYKLYGDPSTTGFTLREILWEDDLISIKLDCEYLEKGIQITDKALWKVAEDFMEREARSGRARVP
ncbi:MAG: hypothetical protein RMI74_08225 [Thermodesulfobacterium sp.]|nr:hypothetical protein [Thermodesulfobacterium sp.]